MFGSNNIVFYVISAQSVAVMGADAVGTQADAINLPASVGQGVGCPRKGHPRSLIYAIPVVSAGPLSRGPACHRRYFARCFRS